MNKGTGYRVAPKGRRGRLSGSRHFLAAVPVIGGAIASIGQAVNTVTDLFGGPEDGAPSANPTDDLRPEVRTWWNSGMGGQWLEDWLIANKPEAFRWTLDELLPLYYVALLDSGKTPFWGTGDARDERLYRQGLTEDAYDALGLDYWATWEKYAALPAADRAQESTRVNIDDVYVHSEGAGKSGGSGGSGSGKGSGGSTPRPSNANVSVGVGGLELLLLVGLVYFIFKGS